ncbi:MAG: YdbL family protein [Aliiglaciecola sp.]|uniref:YdbL family protein n=1 Tax=Aliiglaciecola sp. TaxID=1872441 RepID=UPI003299B7AE
MKILRITMLSALLFCSAVFALELGDAKKSGLVGEQDNGYLGAVVKRSDVLELVGKVNVKRKARYMELAKKNNISLTQVEKLAAQKAFEKTAKGYYVKYDGEWVKK